MIIKKYNSFILERRGVATETIKYSDVVLELTKEYFLEFLKTNDMQFDEVVELKKDYFSFYNKKYPVSEIELEISFNRMPDDAFSKRFSTIYAKGKYFTTTGACYAIGEGGSEKLEDGSIHLKMSVGAIIDIEKFNESYVEDIYLELYSALTHEFNHSYEGYHRDKKGAPGMGTALTFSLDTNVAEVPENVWNIWWKELGYYLYWTESFELNAMIQDAFPYASKYSFEEMKEKTPSWDFYQRMMKFDPIEFKSRLSVEIKKSMLGENPDDVLTRMKDGLAKKLEESLSEDEDETSSIDPKLIRKLDIDQFLEYCNKRIKGGSERLRRGIIKHYSK